MNGIVTAIFGVFESILEWLVGSMESVVPLFYNAETSSLTLIGTLSIVGLGLSVVFLLIGIIRGFLRFR